MGVEKRGYECKFKNNSVISPWCTLYVFPLDHPTCLAQESVPCLQRYFGGMWSRDTLPETVTYPSFDVVNTDLAHRPGEYWIAIILSNNSYGVFFYSFGRTQGELGEEFKDFMDAHVARYDHFDTQIHSNDSISCGLFVLTFLFLFMCMSLSLIECKMLFDVNLSVWNDEMVNAFVNRHFDMCL